ncbi:stage V sporulation protein E [Chlamydia pneumoniae TW-183]|uniref:Probable peptidoglycan glycosyltransferase FtsW n=2 Tax=Chlamydia pneumoniae TaxID=83558 RepID=Q9Z703_CHLPN|nr:putative lipid II flippase FtsW [Chlamydia pneumoniae]AAD19041.1 Cell Division Protein FtsW [Chlamydia pneumoniae CWL029]AAF38743.1 cell division protein FtsW [Chlamydia pneumoniae AR39]AAP98864.1 stage V sporulation protein E [Chlamydia pneumoniae TW-183]CRI33434.1 Putative lipid II flippase FtsW [Chlamydia pneumoniae]CRI36297.1 Putative lipid II flippase FtsW [Chlamydia pneumoniae]
MKWFVISCLLGIFSLGLIMVFDTSSAEVLDRSLECSTHKALIRQVTYLILGLGVASLLYMMEWRDFLKISPVLLSGAALALICVFIPGLGICRNGARRWLGFGQLTIQPSEFVKYLVPIVALYFLTFSSLYQKQLKMFLKLTAILFIPILLIAIEPDNGSAAVISASLIPVFIMTSVRLRYWLLPLLCVLIAGGALAYRMPYVRYRLNVYLHPELDIKGRGHQPYQAKIAAGSGKLLGKGPGASLQKLTYLPEAQNDYIAAIYAEEFGFLGMLVLILLYMCFVYGGYAIAIKASSLEGAALAMVITLIISMQAFMNLGVVSGLLPSKGVNLPFFSQGGSSLIANMCGVTLLLKVYDEENSKSSLGCRRFRRPHCPSSLGKGSFFS